MHSSHKNLILWSAVFIFITAIVFYNFSKNNHVRLASEATKIDSPQATFSNQNSLPPSSPLQQAKLLEVKIYQNTQYEFEFTYPASFGDVLIKKYECPPGSITVGSFSYNPNIDFGFSTNDYQRCEDFGLVLFETRTYDLYDNKLKLYFSDPSLPPVELMIEQTIPTPVPNIIAYIIKNTIDSDGLSSPAAILRSPNPGIGVLIFRTHGLPYQDGVKLLEAVIK